MKHYIFFCLFAMLQQFTNGQSFTAETGSMYPGDKETEISGSLKVVSGVLKKGDKIDIYAPTGRKFSATVLSLTSLDYKELAQQKAGADVLVKLRFTENPTTGKDYLTSGYKVYPAGFNVNTTAIKEEQQKNVAASQKFTALINKKQYRATAPAANNQYWPNGNSMLKQKQPVLLLQFTSRDAPDDRILTIMLYNPKNAPATYGAKELEVNFSGSEDGSKENTMLYGFNLGKATTNFQLQITEWQQSGDRLMLSGKIQGDLPEVLVLGRSKKNGKN